MAGEGGKGKKGRERGNGVITELWITLLKIIKLICTINARSWVKQ